MLTAVRCHRDVGVKAGRIVLTHNQESAIKGVQPAISQRRPMDNPDNATAKEHSSLGDSTVNCRIERAVQESAGVVRTVLLALEARK